MKTDLHKDDKFQKLEKICLLLDILIDCEEYGKFNLQLAELKAISDELDICKVSIARKTIEEKIKKLDDIHPVNDVNFFKIILTSKYVRKLIKDKEKEKKLDTKKVKNLFNKLTEKLLTKIPEPSDKSEEYNRDNQFRIMFLNEISACSESYLAIGYADMALDELNELNELWNLKKLEEKRIKHPYELYALYNKGLTYLHDQRNADEAIETLLQITSLFENSFGSRSFLDEYEGVDDINELYPIYFWLFYVPSKYLIAEAYSDSSSSSNLERSVQEALETIKIKKREFGNTYQREVPKELARIIERYYIIKFGIQLIISAIDKQDERVFNVKTNASNWLENFKEILGDNAIEINETYLNKHPLKNQLEAAKALFFLEHARRDQSKDSISMSLNICIEHLKDDRDPDWSDFACTFLEGVIFALTKLTNKMDVNELLSNNYYERVFNKITLEEWIARKKDLVEKFLDCQERFLRLDEKKYKKRDYCIRYQIELIHNILGEDNERRFKKKWPDCEKEKLVKNLKNTIKRDVKDWWNDNKDKLIENQECKWKGRFENTIQEMKKKLSDDIYKLPEDVGPVSEFIQENMNCDYYTKKLRLNTEQFYDHLIYQSCRPSLNNCYVLTVLRRWQSYTPALSMGSEVGHKGGGYFVYKTNHKGEIEEGLVIDPGFDFLENFFDEGFSIRDISGILITHSHPDHASDFMSILTLVHEMNDRGKRVFRESKWTEKKPIIFIAEGCYQNFEEQLLRKKGTYREIIRVKAVKDNTEWVEKNNPLKHFRLKPTKANHDDKSDHDSVGYIIKDDNGKYLIGFTGDTQWYNKIEDTYIKCPVICMNIGGVVDIFKEPEIKLSDLCDKDDPEHINNINTILLRENHLYLPGFYLMARRLLNIKKTTKTTLLIISELCEEMKGGLRTDLADKISKALYVPVLPEDIGLTVILGNDKKDDKVGHVFCKICQGVHSPTDIVAVETEKDNAIVYLCRDHYEKMREGYSIPKINELELDLNELRKPVKPENSP